MLTQSAQSAIEGLQGELNGEYELEGGIAVHRSAEIEQGAVLKVPVIIGPSSFVAAGAYLRGGVWLEESCIVGPACELKTCFMFAGAKIAHLSFCGDSVMGEGVNIEAGAMIANYRNERDEKRIVIHTEGDRIDTGTDKFGMLCGDDVRIGANAVIAPGAILQPAARVGRLALIDQSIGK